MVPRQRTRLRRAITVTTKTAALIASATIATTVVVIATPSPADPAPAVPVTVQNATQGLIDQAIAKAVVTGIGHAVAQAVRADRVATKAAATSFAASQTSSQPRHLSALALIQIRRLPSWQHSKPAWISGVRSRVRNDG